MDGKKSPKSSTAPESKKRNGISESDKKAKTIEEKYKQMSDREHVLARPDMYAGSCQPCSEWMWILDDQWKPSDDIKLIQQTKKKSSKETSKENSSKEKEKTKTAPHSRPKTKSKSKASQDDDVDEGVGEDTDMKVDKKSKKKSTSRPPRMAKFVHRKIVYVPVLYKIFDEILVNAADNRQRDSNMDTVKVTLNEKTGEISIWNNGKGIPVQQHKEAKMYVPQFIFGAMRAGENFDDSEERTVGGRNGLGAKLTNIFSSQFKLETVDQKNGLRYEQTWTDNMSNVSEPKVTKIKKGETDFTCVTFTPDWSRFQMKGLDHDTLCLLKRRVYDLAGTCNREGALMLDTPLNVYLNGSLISMHSFGQYVECFLDPSNLSTNQSQELSHFSTDDGKWDVYVTSNDNDTFSQVSFVNGIDTGEGGSHVEYITDQVVKSVIKSCQKKSKEIVVKPNMVKSHLFVFVNSLIVNPAFDSQSKRKLKTNKKDFGSECVLSETFLNAVFKSSVGENVLQLALHKNNKILNKSDYKANDRKKIEKLEDALLAGKKSEECTIIFTEGDSAKALAMSGLSVVGRKHYGVFPLKGKVVNVRDAPVTSIAKNKEFANIKKILGLKNGMEYKDVKKLRYGHIMIMTDQDHDGSHIKGLLINMFDHYWPELLKMDGFMQEFITPIVKASKKGKKTISFYTIPDYQKWKAENNDGKGWSIKYYKGLGRCRGGLIVK